MRFGRRAARAGAILLIGSVSFGVAACATPTEAMRPPSPFAGPFGPMVIAHRGGSLEAPENTLAAVRHGAQSGADWVEIDVTLSADDVVVVIHDDTLERTTNGRGEVRRMTLSQLKMLRAGRPVPAEDTANAMGLAGVTAPDFGDRFADETIPTLAEVLAVPDIRLMIELKKIDAPARLVDKVVSAVLAAGAENRVALGSFETALLWAAYDRDPGIPRIGICETAEELKAMMELPVQVLAVRLDLLETALTTAPKGLAIWTWTAYSAEIANFLYEAGAHGIITDVPTSAAALIRKEPDLYIQPTAPGASGSSDDDAK